MSPHDPLSYREHRSMNSNRKHVNCRHVAIVFACVLTTTAFAGTPGIANGDFDSDLSGWELSGTPLPTWAMLDFAGDPGSGSVMLFNAEAQASARVYPLRQCIALPTPGAYSIEADGYLPASHPGGRLVISYSSHALSDCSGGFNSSGGYFLPSNGSWVHGTANIVMNPGINYLDVSLGIEKDLGGGLLGGNIDAVHVINRERIFSNDFESPDLPGPAFQVVQALLANSVISPR